MNCGKKEVLEMESNDDSILEEVRLAVIGYSMRGNILGQFGRLLTKEKKQIRKASAKKIDAQQRIDKLLQAKELKTS